MLRDLDLIYRIHKRKTFLQRMNGTWIHEINTEQSWYDIKGFLHEHLYGAHAQINTTHMLYNTHNILYFKKLGNNSVNIISKYKYHLYLEGILYQVQLYSTFKFNCIKKISLIC